MSHIFISYSRRDIDFAQKIVAALAINDLDTWIDWKSIPKGEDWEQEIYRGIEEADAFLFLISPDSVTSAMCNKEITHAVKNGKRILPIFIADVDDRGIYGVTDKFLYEEQKKEINRRNFIKCREGKDDFDKSLDEIQTTIHTDYEWLKYHTELQVKALKWEQKQDASRLLRGKELREAEEQLAKSQNDPQPTKLQREYILVSQRNEIRVRRQVTFGLVAGLVIMIVLSLIAWGQRNVAISEGNAKATALINEEHAQATAQAEKLHAEEQANIAHAGELAALALVHVDEQPDLSLLLSVEAYRHVDNSATRNSLLTVLQSHPRLLASLNKQNKIAFSPKGRILATSESDSVNLWDLSNVNSIVKLGTTSTDNETGISALSFDPDGKLLASGHNDGTITFLDLSGPAVPVQIGAPLSAHKESVTSMAFSPNGKTLATASGDQTIILWNVSHPATPVQIGQPLNDHTYHVSSVTFSPDGSILASGSFDKSIILWDVSDMTAPRKLGEILSSGIYDIAFSPDGATLAADNNDNSISLWDVSDPTMPVRFGQPLIGQKKPSRSLIFDFVVSLAFSPNGKMIAVGGFDHTVVLWDVSNLDAPVQIGETLVGHASRVWNMEFSPDSRMLASSDGYSTLLWDVSSISSPAVPSFSTLKNERGITAIAFQQRGNITALANEDGSIALLNLSNPAAPVPISTLQTNLDSRVFSVAFSTDNNILASGSENGTLLLWDVSNPNHPVRFNNSLTGSILAMSPKEQILASESTESPFILWDLSNPNHPVKMNDPLTTDQTFLASMAFSPDGKILATGSDTIILWDVSDPSKPTQLNSPITGFPSGIVSLAFSQDDRVLASGSYDQTVTLWDVSDPTAPVQIGNRLTTHFGPVLALAFSPMHTGSVIYNLLASGSSDNTIILWDVSNPSTPVQLGYPLTGHGTGISSLAFNSNGNLLISGSWDGRGVFWDIDPASWDIRACQIAGRNFTQIEWAQYFPNEPYHLTCPQWPVGQ